MAAIKRYKNWGTAVSAAGIDYGSVRLRRMMSKTEIKKEILDLYDSGVDLAYPNMKENHLYLLAAGMKKLGNGSWAKARKLQFSVNHSPLLKNAFFRKFFALFST